MKFWGWLASGREFRRTFPTRAAAEAWATASGAEVRGEVPEPDPVQEAMATAAEARHAAATFAYHRGRPWRD